MNLKMIFKNKDELNFFYNNLIRLFNNSQNEIDFLHFYNILDLLRILNKKIIDITFFEKKTLTIKVTPNHFNALEFIFDINVYELKKNDFDTFLTFSQHYENLLKQFENSKNCNFEYRKQSAI